MSRILNIGDLISSRPDILDLILGDRPIAELFDLPTTISTDRVAEYKRLYHGVGNTRVKLFALPNGDRVVLKQECTNAVGGSHYSRYWLPYLFIAETLGIIAPNRTHLIEVTSGNSGLTLALAAHPLGYAVTLIAPKMLPAVRLKPLGEAGAHVITVEGYIKECVGQLRRFLTTGQYFTPNHSEEASDLLVHIMRRVALEAIADYPNIISATTALGNGCSAVGLLQPFQQYLPSVKRRIYWPSDDFDTPVLGLCIQEIELRHLNLAKAMAQHVRIHGRLNDVIHGVQERIDLLGSNLGWSTYLGLHAILEALPNSTAMADGQDHFMVCYDSGDRY